ncbi:flavodoxin family protein [Oscillospiraceae bacterium CM]|nr:flavodoxin family protein [Oscillospiraceae bacterium CM]
MRISILYVSQSGNTEKAAGFIREGIQLAGSVDVKLMNLSNEGALDAEFVKDSAAVIIGTPTYAAGMAWQLKKWLDTDRSVNLSGKLGAAFSTANFVHGGADVAIADVLHHLLVKGMLVYSSGAGCGKPIIHLGPVAIAGALDNTRDLFVTFGRRVAEKALALFGA